MRTRSGVAFGHDVTASTTSKSAAKIALDTILSVKDSRKARLERAAELAASGDGSGSGVDVVSPPPKGSGQARRQARTVSFEQLPAWMQLDPQIRRGYRLPTGRVLDCFASLFYPHNELVNTWSHLAPAGFFVVLFAGWGPHWVGMAGLDRLNRLDWAMLQLYFACTALCLIFSAGFHGLNCHSQNMAKRTLKFDYLGIVLTITSTAITSTYFGLHGRPDLQKAYISCIVLCGAAVFYAVLGPNTDGAGAAAWRAAIFSALGASGFGAILHVALTEGQDGLARFPLINIGVTCSCYLLGTYLYVRRFPESRWPETFDIWGASHQLFHTLVAIGQIVFLYGLKDCFWMHH